MQQGGLYDNAGPGVSGGDAGDAVMARWLQSAGLQHLASPMSSNAVDHRLLLMQGYGPTSAEEKQRLVKLMRNLNFNGENVSESYTPTPSAAMSGAFAPSDGYFSPEFRGDFGAGLLDLHSMDDTELLSDHVMTEPFEPSPFMPAASKAFESDIDGVSNRQLRGQTDAEAPVANEKEYNARENNVAKIKVVVRKRPLNKKETARKEDDIVSVYDDSYLTVHEPKLKVDLTAYVEKHEFCFDAVLDEQVSNDEVYCKTVKPIIPTIFQRTKATCFAYGQTGSGKTYTMQPLPLRAAEDLVRLLHQPVNRNQRLKLWLSYFEIYGGKLYDLLSERKKLCMREDGRQQVCIVGLQEFEVSDVAIVKEFIERGNAARSTGSTGANEESSRSHAILQLVVKKHPEVKESRRNNYNNNDTNESRVGKVVGKISFIDLAGSERGADTTDNDRQTRIEGAEINKSLLALKECIRALDNDQIHIPFRGSKLTEVLRDSFVGNSRTVMISCISPGAGSCEHTLNTLRYADRVKSLSKSGNPRKDQASSLPSNAKESSSAATTSSVAAEAEGAYEQRQESKAVDTRRVTEKETSSFNFSTEDEKQPTPSFSSNFNFNGREDSGMAAAGSERERLDVRNSLRGSTSQKTSSVGYTQNSNEDGGMAAAGMERERFDVRNSLRGSTSQKTSSVGYNQSSNEDSGTAAAGMERERFDVRNSLRGSTSQKTSSVGYTQSSNDVEDKVQKTSPPRQKYRDDRLEKPGLVLRRDYDNSGIMSPTSYRQQNSNNSNANTGVAKQNEPEPPPDSSINETLEEEEALIAAHRKEIEDTMEIVREEMKLLAEVDQPGSHIDNYVTQLSFVLSRKAASLVSLQARLARFQHRLREQEILSRKRVPR